MDRSVDGGMAPALQSCNHQSTGLVSQEVEGSKEEDVVPHEKLNGGTYPRDSMREDPVSGGETSPIAADASGDSDSRDLLSNESEFASAPKQACILSGLKETLPEVSMPAIQHIGQGDSTAQNVVSYNGWGDCRKTLAGGVLQESNNISVPHLLSKGLNKKPSVTKAEGVKASVKKSEDENQPNGGFQGVPHNGDLMARSPNTLLQPQIETATTGSAGDTVTFSAVTSNQFVDTNNLIVTDRQVTSVQCDNNVAGTGIALVLSNFDSNEAVGHNLESPLQTHEDQEHLELHSQEVKGLDYTDLLSSDLSKINMSDKLANTLQEVAASLKGSGISLSRDDTTQTASYELHNTVNNVDQGLSGGTCEGGATENSSLTKKKLRIERKGRTAVSKASVLNRRLQTLRRSVDALQCRVLTRHVSKEILDVSRCIPLIKIVDTSVPPHASEAEDKNFTTHSAVPSEFWSKLFQNSETQSKKVSESEVPPTNRRLSKVLAENDKITVKQEPASENGLSSGVVLIDMDPIVQLTRVEDLKVETGRKKDLASRAFMSSGVLRKELKSLRSCCDPELTESSSDEDIAEPAVRKSNKSKTSLKTTFAEPSTRSKFRKSFCKWAAERAEISRRWTWLQSRISSLEFDIRQQGDLYSQMRESKGIVQLEVSSSFPGRTERLAPADPTLPKSVPVSSPCNVNMVVDNVHNQTTRLLDNLSPLSGGSPSPNQAPSLNSSPVTASASMNSHHQTGSEHACARVKQLCLAAFRNRKLVKITPSVVTSDKGLKPKTVPNDSCVMCVDQKQAISNGDFGDCKYLVQKAAIHDHSYHSVISSIGEIPASISMRAVMKSRRKWCKKSSPDKQENKVLRKHKKRKRRHKTQAKNKRLYSTVPCYVDNSKRRKLSSQASDSSRKRPRDGSMDSDLDSSVVIGGFSSHPLAGSRATTPTNDIAAQSQTYWKKKKTSEQAYDINNIVIPHGLNSTRIEKLAYKEIQTPSWKTLELSPVSEKEEDTKEDESVDFEVEDTSAAAFQQRHDSYEIIEKRKYMAFMEWSITRRGSRGSRMGNIRGPTMPDPDSPTPLSFAASPVSFVREPFSSTIVTSMPSVSSPATSAVSPTAKPGVTTRRMSSDQNISQPGTPPSHHQQHTQRNADTSLSYSFSSPSLASWHEGLGLHRGSLDTAAPVNRTLSDGTNTCKHDQADSWTWEMRSFPLSDEDMKLLEDLEYAKMMLNRNKDSPERHHSQDAADGGRSYPFVRQSSGEKYPLDHSRSGCQDGIHIKASAAKRRRTDSRASSLTSHDDTARHSDCSNASASSAHRKRRRSSFIRSRSSQQKQGYGRGKGPLRRFSSSNYKHKYLDIRLSETDDSTSDSDTGSNSSEDDSTESYDDAGNVVDDYADPEWECPKPRDRR